VDVLAVLDSLQFGFNYRRCPLCAGWNVGPNGETDKVHTATCPVPQARAAIAELIEAAQSIFRAVEANAAPVNVMAALREVSLEDGQISLAPEFLIALFEAHAKAKGESA
jgi:hypothetical protein